MTRHLTVSSIKRVVKLHHTILKVKNPYKRNKKPGIGLQVQGLVHSSLKQQFTTVRSNLYLSEEKKLVDKDLSKRRASVRAKADVQFFKISKGIPSRLYSC
jgi:hypothetical protein